MIEDIYSIEEAEAISADAVKLSDGVIDEALCGKLKFERVHIFIICS